MLPWAGFIMFRRLMILPFGAAGLLLVLIHHSSLPLGEISAGGAIFLGVQLLQMSACMMALGDSRLVGSVPSYLVFRIIVSFYALETLLGLAFHPNPAEPDNPRERPDGVARKKIARPARGLSPRRLGDVT
jgi:hypothetical protein